MNHEPKKILVVCNCHGTSKPHTLEAGVKLGCPSCVWVAAHQVKTPEKCFCGLAWEHTGKHAEVLKPTRTTIVLGIAGEQIYKGDLVVMDPFDGTLRRSKM